MKRVDDVEFFELMQKIYPKHFKDDNESLSKAQEFLNSINELCSQFDDTSFFKLDEFIEKLVYLAPPLQSPLTGDLYHVLGVRGSGYFTPIIKRELKLEGETK